MDRTDRRLPMPVISLKRDRFAGALTWLAVLAIAIFPAFLIQEAAAQQCKPKTEGYFKQMAGFSQRASSPVVMVGIVQSLTGQIGNPAEGRSLILSRDKGNCTACHRLPNMTDAQKQGGIGPDLKGVGRRYTEAQLRQIIADPYVFFPDSAMPAYHKIPDYPRIPQALAGKRVLTAMEVENIVAFLKNLK